jgi:hypothetical protein
MNRLMVALASVLLTGSAFAAQTQPVASLTAAQGSVLINQGKQFVTAQVLSLIHI